ncbi:MAG TPA: hypothetical protein VE548_00025 [Nitrososphaeraceae archaeon]|jgi:flagellar biosynthesis component FlhA|nr:hypothetical protein [Nitrososphaeraceae archaeon]
MPVTTFKDTNGKIWAKGMPYGSIVLYTFGILFLIIGILVMIAAPGIGSIAILAIANIILFISRKYGNHVRQKVANRALRQEIELEEQNKLHKDKTEFEEFKKWKEQQAIDQKKKGLEPVESESEEFKEG